MTVRIVSVMARFTKAVDFTLYRINNRSQRYSNKTAGLANRGTMHMEQMIRSYILDGRDPVAIINVFVKVFEHMKLHQHQWRRSDVAAPQPRRRLCRYCPDIPSETDRWRIKR